MARTKSDKSVWIIFFEALKIFCLNIHKFLLYMTFPVLGQVVGIFLIFGLSYWFNNNVDMIVKKYPIIDNVSMMSVAVLVLTLPGLLIFVKAFWKYLVAYVALNSMAEGAVSTGRVYDFPAHNAVVYNRKFTFIMLWLLFGIFTLIASFPLLWIIGGILFIYFVLIFQVFTFEDGISATGCFKRSITLIKGKFARTAVLMFGLIGLFYLLFKGTTVLFEVVNLNRFFLEIFETWAMTLPLNEVNAILSIIKMEITPLMVAEACRENVTLFIAFGFLLPLRSIAWTLWYKNLNNNTMVCENTPKKQRKTARKKLDKNILKRAMQEDDE